MNEKVKKGNVLLSDKYKEDYNDLGRANNPKLFNNLKVYCTEYKITKSRNKKDFKKGS